MNIRFAVGRGTAGNNAPNRREGVGKFTETTGQITDIEGFNEQAGSFDTNTNLTVLGSEITPAAAIPGIDNVQDNSLFIEKDTANRYWKSSSEDLKAYYKFADNGTNSATTEQGLGSSADMTVTGATYTTGKLGNAISFDGTNDYAVIGSSTSDFNFLANTSLLFPTTALTSNCISTKKSGD